MSQLPDSIDKLFEEIRNEVLTLHVNWKIYRQLFAHTPLRVDLLNESACTFFYVTQELLYNDVQLRLSKLTDPSKTGGFRNLSLPALLESVEDKSFRATLESIIDDLQKKCKPFRNKRNKEIAHLDFDTVMKSVPTPDVSRKMIEDALTLLAKFLNEIEGHYMDSETSYDVIISEDGESLVNYVKYGMRYAELRKQREVNRNDIRKSKWFDA